MKVQELNREQLIELKQSYYTHELGYTDASYCDIATIDDIISDDEIMDYYADTDFVNDDFFCSANL